MTAWGDPFGSPWGGSEPFSSVLADRVLMFSRGARFRALAAAIGVRTDILVMQIAAIAGAFDLDAAEGQQLTRIGEIVQRPRNGMDDDRYRRVLRAHVDILLSSQGSTDTLFAVVRAITGFAAPEYSESYPKTFSIGAFVDPDEITLLAQLLREAKDWGTNGSLVVYPEGSAPGEGGVLLCDVTIGGTVDDPGLLDATTGGPVVGAYPMAAEVVV